MTLYEYQILQDRLSAKLIKGRSTNKEEAYNNGVLACKSILKEIYEQSMWTDKSKGKDKP